MSGAASGPGGVLAAVEDRLARIAADPGAAIFLAVDAAGARAAAAAADARSAAGILLGPLDGRLVAAKDNLAMAGLPWTAGIEGRRGLVAGADAGTVARLRAAGAVVLGGVNLHEGALGATTDNEAFGRCANPAAPGCTPGGSSGGSAAAVAAGLADLALGTDTMGSVRIPAAYCGLAGIKPTRGLVGRSGLAFLCPSLDSIGPLARRAAELWPALSVIAGPDAGDPESLPAPADWAARPAVSLAGVRLGTPRQIEAVDCEPEVRAAFRAMLDRARALGAETVELDLAGWDPGRARRAGLLLSEAEGAVEMAGLLSAAEADPAPDPAPITPYLRALLAYGRDAGAARVVEAHARLRAAAAACLRGLAEVDALILPTAPQRAFPHGTPAPANQADFTALANFAGVPAVAIPAPVPAEAGALPASIQLVGPAWSEARLLAWAEAFEA